MVTVSPAAAAPPTPVTPRRPSSGRGPDPLRRVALAAGLLYLVTFAASVPQLALFSPVVDDPEGFVAGAGSTGPVLLGTWLEVITAIAGIGTAVALYPVTRRVSRTAAIGFITSRVTECTLILVGVVLMLSVVTLRGDLAGATGTRGDALGVTAHALVVARQWTFLVGPGLIAGINGLFLASVVYRARLVPRLIPVVGLVGAPLILVSATGTMFGLWDQVSPAGVALGIPVAAWELALGLWMTIKGFRTDALGSPAAAPAPPA